MTTEKSGTLRLVFPQWQGGNNPAYYFGTKLLAWLAPDHEGPQEEVPVAPATDVRLTLQKGVIGRDILLEQARHAQELLAKHAPDKVVVLGGDCLVDLAPFAYLNDRYQGDLAVLWVDAHPDIMTPAQFQHAHAMVLGMLLGQGEPDFAEHVKRPLLPRNVMYLGVNNSSRWEHDEMRRLGLHCLTPQQFGQQGSSPLIEWFNSTGASHLAIHLDLDVLAPSSFRSLLFAQPDIPADQYAGVAQGQLNMDQVLTAIGDLSSHANVVGIGVTEHLPWDALALREMLYRLPLISQAPK